MNCNTYFDKKINIKEAICLMETKINELVEMYNRIDADHAIIAEKVRELEKLIDYLLGAGLAEEVKKKLEEWLADGTLADIIGDTLDKWTGRIDDIEDEIGIKKYNNSISEALKYKKSIKLGVGEYILTETLSGLADKTIIGSGEKTIIKIDGNFNAFHITSVNFTLKNVKIIVPIEYTSTVLLFTDNLNSVYGNTIENVIIDTTNEREEKYTVCNLSSRTGNGIHDNFINLKAYHFANGINLEAISDGAWTTHNEINDLYLRNFTNYAIRLNEAPGCSIINNNIINPRLLDFTQKNIERTAIIIDGRYNNIENIQMFNDGANGICKFLELKNIHVCYSNNISGNGEGLIINQHKLKDNNVNLNVVKRKNSQDYMPNHSPSTKYTTNITNLLHNSDFRSGAGLIYGVGATVEVVNDSGKNYLLITKTANANAKVQLEVPKANLLQYKTLSFSCKTRNMNNKCYAIMSNGGEDFLKGSLSSDVNEIISVSKQSTSENLYLMVAFDDSVEIGKQIIIDTMCLNEGTCIPLSQPYEQPLYKITNKGQVEIGQNETEIVVNHGLSITPKLEDITLTQLNWSNDTEFFITETNSTTFKIQLNKAHGIHQLKLGWKIDLR